jgi:hypothetical protein
MYLLYAIKEIIFHNVKIRKGKNYLINFKIHFNLVTLFILAKKKSSFKYLHKNEDFSFFILKLNTDDYYLK